MFCCTLLYVRSSFAIILMRKSELVVLLILSSWCLVMVEWLFLAMPWDCLQFVIVVFPDYTHYFGPDHQPPTPPLDPRMMMSLKWHALTGQVVFFSSSCLWDNYIRVKSIVSL